MRRRVLAGASASASAVFVGLLSLPLNGQQSPAIGANTPPLVITAYNGGPPIPYKIWQDSVNYLIRPDPL